MADRSKPARPGPGLAYKALVFACAAVLCLLAFAAPTWIRPGMRPVDGLLPAVATGYEGYGGLTFGLHLGGGFLIGVAFRAPMPLVIAATLVPLPLWLLVETAFGPNPSNIWPLALVICLFLSLAAVFGAVVGWGLREWLFPRRVSRRRGGG